MNRPIQVIERAFRVLSTVAENGGAPVQLNEIAARAGLKLSTAARIAQSLVSCGALKQPTRKKGYALGPKIPALAGNKIPHKRLAELAKPLVDEFSKNTGEALHLAVLDGIQRRVILYCNSTKNIWVKNGEAPSGPDNPCMTLSGRLLLAGLPEQEQRTFFRLSGAPGALWPEAKDESSFCQELKKIKGADRLFREHDDVAGVCMPVLVNGVCKATLGSFIPAYRYAGNVTPLVDFEMKKFKERLEELIKKDGVQA